MGSRESIDCVDEDVLQLLARGFAECQIEKGIAQALSLFLLMSRGGDSRRLNGGRYEGIVADQILHPEPFDRFLEPIEPVGKFLEPFVPASATAGAKTMDSTSVIVPPMTGMTARAARAPPWMVSASSASG